MERVVNHDGSILVWFESSLGRRKHFQLCYLNGVTLLTKDSEKLFGSITVRLVICYYEIVRQTKFIVLRGPSGSGKSTVAKELFKRATHRIALIEQDYYRFIFKPAGGGSKPNSSTINKMLKNDVLVALKDGYDVILEGILSVKSYEKVLDEIFAEHSGENYMFHFDISFEETIRRHATRKVREPGFGEEDMREWYSAAHRSNHELEQIIPETFSLQQTIQFIEEASSTQAT